MIKIPTASITAIIIVIAAKMPSALSLKTLEKALSTLDSFAASSSSKKLAEKFKVFIPIAMDSAKLSIPLRMGSFHILCFSEVLLKVSSFITISLSGFLTATA